jgi:hypothetical protein
VIIIIFVFDIVIIYVGKFSDHYIFTFQIKYVKEVKEFNKHWIKQHRFNLDTITIDL